jgi:sterol desaturase/sphingolipid hydroxylase (fatty acid hydroxylase superfamily)
MTVDVRVLRVAAYPLLVGGGLAVLWGVLEAGMTLVWAPFAAVAIVGPLVLALERIIPFRPAWDARPQDYVEDGFFMVVVQVVVPALLGWALAYALSTAVADSDNWFHLWPSEWPLAAQLALKVVAGDFLRYWLHRCAHSWGPLWRLHEVHHHPEKLYATNVFRFHPIEKSLQFCCDTLPFVLIGIGSDALAYYFVFYAISGLTQHCNADIRLGPLNYVFSGPELHRWHHSRLIAESNNNYAHSFVVWDLLFGTYFRPRARAVEKLGLIDPDYPRGFWRQMVAPFRPTTTRAP